MRTTTVIEQTTVGNRSHVTEVTCDDPAQAIAAVERLNGRDRSTIAFDASNATVMTIGGGHDGRYVVFIASEIDAALLNLTAPEANTRTPPISISRCAPRTCRPTRLRSCPICGCQPARVSSSTMQAMKMSE
ncbi:hypothetical protein LGM43_27575 [Burkholderia seminalis]|uniref:hypothetical protein n=1 Tax=Burkholderia seminalis TaxID=488731 RepID=UPI001CF33638|nr:hypothetical protein [Burkholderia seminalis]MCA7954036.1 hypothetical protein [Burkholderia seminalis]